MQYSTLDLSTRSVLFVDDEPRITHSLRLALRKEPYSILTANSASEALETLQANDVAAVVSDERMPGMSGSELLAEIHQRHPQTVSMILSGQSSIEAAIRAINEGQIFRFFRKPIDHDELKIGIRSALQQHLLLHELEALRAEKMKHDELLDQLETRHPGITSVAVDEDGAFVLDAEALSGLSLGEN